MSERPQPLEGWHVHARPAVLGMAAFLTLLIGGVTTAGFYYDTHFRPRTHARLRAFPKPGLETMQHVPHQPIGPGPPRPRGIDAAMRAVAAEGDAAWAGQGRRAR